MSSIPADQKAFTRPYIDVSRPLSELEQDSIRSLPDLIKFNAQFNSDHIFAQQEVREHGHFVGFTTIDFATLRKVILESISWINKTIMEKSSKDLTESQSPVALFLESDVTLFVHLCALLEMGVPVLLLSARLSKLAIKHLLSETAAQSIICSARTEQVANSALESLTNCKGSLKLVKAVSYRDLLKESSLPHRTVPKETLSQDSASVDDRPGALILHSSGTTGLPKPIPLAHRYILGYAQCHRLKPSEAEGRLNLSTLPLYHGFGLLSPCLSLSTGKTCLFPSSSVIPAAESTAELLRITPSQSLMTVPTILEEMVNSDSRKEYCQLLSRLDFVAIGGGPLKIQVAEILAENGVKLLNHYGVTEVGAIAFIFLPDKTYDWHYLRLRSDMRLDLKVIEENGEKPGIYKLIGYPFGWGKPFEIQDRLERNPSSSYLEVRVLGRSDDLIVLASGEKVLPQQLETDLSKLDCVKFAVVFGENRNEIGVLIEPMDHFMSSPELIKNTIWDALQDLNKKNDGHARISSPNAILLSNPDKSIPLSDKGSVQRRETYERFAEEINEIYDSIGNYSGVNRVYLNKETIAESLRAVIQSCIGDRISCESWTADEDFFERGMDSLEALRLARKLSNLQNQSDFPQFQKSAATIGLVYKNPTISKLARALLGDSVGARDAKQRRREMRMLKTKYTSTINSSTQNGDNHKWVVLLTGSTGNLGTNLLARFVKDRRVRKVICLNRKGDLRSQGRQERSNSRQGINFTKTEWAKIEFIERDTQSENLGLSSESFGLLASQVTHLVHNAWPMDFQRTLQSYESQIRVLSELLQLARRASLLQRYTKPNVLFLSSIAAGARYPGKTLREAPIEDPAWASSMGYAEAKWVCEELMANAARLDTAIMEPIVVRIGQLTGSSISGYWNQNEHLPVLIQASQALGVLPELQGTYSWLPTDVAAATIRDILFSRKSRKVFYNVENPIRQPWSELITCLAYKLKLREQKPIPLNDWIHEAAKIDPKDSRIQYMKEFLQTDFRSLAQGGVVLDTQHSREASPTLFSCGGIELGLLDKYIKKWREEGFLD